ncbi:hypothetical protein D3C76_1473290 [compost metagenome]
MCSIFYHRQTVFSGNRHDAVHLTGDTGIVYRYDCFGSCCDGGLNQSFVNIECVFTNVDEHWHATSKYEGIGRRDEGVGRHDDLITWLNVQQQGSHFQSSSARVGE